MLDETEIIFFWNFIPKAKSVAKKSVALQDFT